MSDAQAASLPPVTEKHAPRSKIDLFVSFTLLALQGFGGVLAVVQRELVE
jgi:chromate transporter